MKILALAMAGAAALALAGCVTDDGYGPYGGSYGEPYGSSYGGYGYGYPGDALGLGYGRHRGTPRAGRAPTYYSHNGTVEQEAPGKPYLDEVNRQPRNWSPP